MAFEDYWELIGLGIDLGLAALFYKLYKDKTKAAEQIRTAPVLTIDRELLESVQQAGELAYVCVEGCVAPLRQGDTLRSRFTEDVGVIRHTLQTEHKSKRESGYWRDVKRVIKDYYDKVPFVLGSGEVGVFVERPLEAHHLDEEVRVTHDQFEEAAAGGLLSRGIDRLFGDVSRGFQETERMLRVGAGLLGVGRLSVEEGALRLGPPLGGERYVLTGMSRRELVQALLSGAWWLRLVWLVCGGVGAGLLGLWLWRRVRAWWGRREERRVYTEIRQQVAHITPTGGEEGEDSSTCVVCLTNRRNVVLLHCGHICLCVDCAEALPSPKRCPVCRAQVARLVPTYVP